MPQLFADLCLGPQGFLCLVMSGSDAEFIRKSIASGTLGRVGTPNVQADVDARRRIVCSPFLRIMQNGEVRTVDASVGHERDVTSEENTELVLRSGWRRPCWQFSWRQFQG